MGALNSKERKLSRKLDKKLKEEGSVDKRIIKLLLLGPGESGKSTIYKQMRLLYLDGFSDDMRASLKQAIVSNLLDGTKAILDHCGELGSSKAKDAAKTVLEFSKSEQNGERISFLDGDVSIALSTLWSDKEFQKSFEDRSKFQLPDSYRVFAEKNRDQFPKWGGKEWVPDNEDVLSCRIRTTGITEEHFEVDGDNIHVYDVGGQRSERKKWIHCFEHVTAVIYVASMSGYDQTLFEDSTTNRLQEAVVLFEEICRSQWFTNTAIILFLNKRDLFEEKFVRRQIPINVSGEFPGAPTPSQGLEQAHEWFRDMFKSKAGTHNVYHHFTCASDTTNIDAVFRSTKDIVLQDSLRNIGLVE